MLLHRVLMYVVLCVLFCIDRVKVPVIRASQPLNLCIPKMNVCSEIVIEVQCQIQIKIDAGNIHAK
jgi:hypothetical protein